MQMNLLPVRPDVIRRPLVDAVRMKGLVGQRFDASRENRLRHQEDYHLLWPFQEHCPVGWNHPKTPHPEITRGDWQGEFIGTWVSAATTTAWNAGDDELRAKVGALVKAWIATQEEDGYLGTYDEADRWKSWDVWVQAHDLIGLLSYYFHSGSQEARQAAIRVADRVLKDFGPGRQYLHTGPHGGMASSAILEPMIWLYWETGDQRYLDFGRWLVDEDWEAPGGAAIRSSLLSGKGVAGTANGKAAEMLIDFTGMVELYRATGDDRYLQPVLIAWDDIVQHHLYITGSASTGEHFFPDYLLRNDGLFRLGETCVTMTWMYLNLSLGRLTGEARFFDMVEQALYNHLLAAQSPNGRGWAYYVGLRDNKRYRWHTDPDCCPTRGVRALAQMPQYVFGLSGDGVTVNFYEPAQALLTLASGAQLQIGQEGEYPFAGNVRLHLDPQDPTRFALRLRVPGWCRDWRLSINGAVSDVQPDAKGYLVLERVWSSGDMVELAMEMPVHVVADELGNPGRVALMRGPLVYAADSSYLPGGRLLDDIVLLLDKENPARGVRVIKDEGTGSVHLIAPSVIVRPALGAGVWREPERYHDLVGCDGERVGEDVTLVPFYEAGNRDPKAYREVVITNSEAATNVTYQVWLPYTCS